MEIDGTKEEIIALSQEIMVEATQDMFGDDEEMAIERLEEAPHLVQAVQRILLKYIKK